MRIVKWVVVPLGVGFVGYRFVGPALGGKVVERAKAVIPSVAPAGSAHGTPPASETPTRLVHNERPPAPDVEVSVRRSSDGNGSEPRRRSRSTPEEASTTRETRSSEDADAPVRRPAPRRRAHTPPPPDIDAGGSGGSIGESHGGTETLDPASGGG